MFLENRVVPSVPFYSLYFYTGKLKLVFFQQTSFINGCNFEILVKYWYDSVLKRQSTGREICHVYPDVTLLKWSNRGQFCQIIWYIVSFTIEWRWLGVIKRFVSTFHLWTFIYLLKLEIVICRYSIIGNHYKFVNLLDQWSKGYNH
jgi:hypothetical protein